MGALAKCIKGRCNQHQLSMAITMAGNTLSKYNNPDAYWCPDCDYKTNERVNLDNHSELNHKTVLHFVEVCIFIFFIRWSNLYIFQTSIASIRSSFVGEGADL